MPSTGRFLAIKVFSELTSGIVATWRMVLRFRPVLHPLRHLFEISMGRFTRFLRSILLRNVTQGLTLSHGWPGKPSLQFENTLLLVFTLSSTVTNTQPGILCLVSCCVSTLFKMRSICSISVHQARTVVLERQPQPGWRRGMPLLERPGVTGKMGYIFTIGSAWVLREICSTLAAFARLIHVN